jgi:hypothetical protein
MLSKHFILFNQKLKDNLLIHGQLDNLLIYLLIKSF